VSTVDHEGPLYRAHVHEGARLRDQGRNGLAARTLKIQALQRCGVIAVTNPWSGLVLPGVLVGVDMVMHGLWWLALGLLVRRPRAGTLASA
jgi:hypothetical protein